MTAHSRADANRSLWFVLSGAIAAWLLFLAALFSNILVEAGRTSDELWGPDAEPFVRPSSYLLFASIAVLTLGALLGKRSANALIAAHPEHRLARSVRYFSSTVIIVGLALSAIAAVAVFLTNLYESSDQASVLVRALNSYVPILLHTSLVVSVILIGFVFARSAPSPGTADIPEMHLEQPIVDAEEARQAQRATAISYAVPIVSVAVALIFGLVVYDLTRTPLDVWIWVVVQVFVAAGIVAGTFFAARAIRVQRRAGSRPAGVSVGAETLNIVLSIVFVVIVTGMSMNYGAQAIEQLRVQTSLSVSVYHEDLGAGSERFRPEEGRVDVNGSGYARGSTAELVLEPGGTQLLTVDTDRSRYFWAETALPSGLDSGRYDVTLQATAPDGVHDVASVPIIVTEDGMIELPNETYAQNEERPTSVAAFTGEWLLAELLPAFLLLAIVIGTLHLTLNLRAGGDQRPATAAAASRVTTAHRDDAS